MVYGTFIISEYHSRFMTPQAVRQKYTVDLSLNVDVSRRT